MDCKTADHYFEDYLDSLLDAGARDGFEAHVKACPDCRGRLESVQELKDALKCFPEPVLHPDFAARAFKQAAAGSSRLRTGTSTMVRIAASLLVMVALGFMFKGALGPGQPEWPETFVRLNRPEEVQLVFYSAQKMENVTLALLPPEGVELVGFENRREIVWKTDLERGENLLVLPVIVRNREGGSLIAEIRHGDRNKQFRIRLKTRPPDAPVPAADRIEGSMATLI